MATVRNRSSQRKFHAHAYDFVFSAMRFTQENLGRNRSSEQFGHITGPELLDGVRELGLRHFGMLAIPVFSRWGIRSTDDFGRIVFELIERGEMRKTDDDHLTDYQGVYDFRKVFYEEYTLDTTAAFS